MSNSPLPPPSPNSVPRIHFSSRVESRECVWCFRVTVSTVANRMFLEGTPINWCFPCPYFHKLGFLRAHSYHVLGHRHTVFTLSCSAGMFKYLEIKRCIAWGAWNFSSGIFHLRFPSGSLPYASVGAKTFPSGSSGQHIKATLTWPTHPISLFLHPPPLPQLPKTLKLVLFTNSLFHPLQYGFHSYHATERSTVIPPAKSSGVSLVFILLKWTEAVAAFFWNPCTLSFNIWDISQYSFYLSDHRTFAFIAHFSSSCPTSGCVLANRVLDPDVHPFQEGHPLTSLTRFSRATLGLHHSSVLWAIVAQQISTSHLITVAYICHICLPSQGMSFGGQGLRHISQASL